MIIHQHIKSHDTTRKASRSTLQTCPPNERVMIQCSRGIKKSPFEVQKTNATRGLVSIAVSKYFKTQLKAKKGINDKTVLMCTLIYGLKRIPLNSLWVSTILRSSFSVMMYQHLVLSSFLLKKLLACHVEQS